jgi:hypothetical protein
VVEALNAVAKWVAKLPALAPAPAPAPALALPLTSLIAGPSSALGSPIPEVEALLARQPTRQGTRRQRALVDVEDQDQVQAQILGEVEAIHPIEPAMGRGKRVKISRK